MSVHEPAKAFVEKYGRMFSPSGSSRWLFCTGSIALEKQLKDRHPDHKELPSIYASRGTVAHSIGAKCIENDISPYTFIGEDLVSEDEAELTISVDNQLANGVNIYVNYALSLIKQEYKPIYEIEKTLDLSHISPYMPSGTSDFWCHQRATKTLYVVDYKNGAIDVDPVHNTQMMIYSLGVIKRLIAYYAVLLTEIEKVVLVIVQPNAREAKEPIRFWETTIDTLMWFEEYVRSTVRNTMDGKIYFAPTESRCRWCRGGAVCTEKSKLALQSAKLDFDELLAYEDQNDDSPSPIGQIIDEVREPQLPAVDMLTPREIGFMLKWQNRVEEFFKTLGVHALTLKRQGQNIPGIKAVRGRANRIWKLNSEETAVVLAKRYGLDRDDLYEEPKFKTPAKIEQLLKAKKIAAEDLDELIEKPMGEIKLAPLGDKRPEVKFELEPQHDFIEFKK